MDSSGLRIEHLTRRENDILILLGHNLSDREITGGWTLEAAVAFPQTPGRGCFWFWRSMFPLFFYTKRAIPFAFGLHHVRFAGLFGFSIFLKGPADLIAT